MTNKELVLRYLDKLDDDVIVTANRIARSASSVRGLDPFIVKNIMQKLVDQEKWTTVRCWSSDGHRAYRRL